MSGRLAALRPMIGVLVLDVGLALIAYYGARLLGFSEYVALLAGAVVAAVRVVWVALRRRSFDAFAALLGLVLVVGLALLLVTGDARFLLVKESFGTAVIGLAILGSGLAGRPVVRTAVLGMVPKEKAREIEEHCRASAAARRSFTVMTYVWGGGLFAEALLRVPLVYLVPVDLMAGLSQLLLVATILLLAWWTAWYAQRVFPDTPAEARA